MSDLLDKSPFPWTHPLATTLHTTLTDLYPSGKGAGFVAAQAGLDTNQVNLDQAPTFVWMDLLALGGKQGQTRDLVQTVHDRLLPTAPKRAFLADLLADRTPPADPEPRAQDGTPSFADTVTDPEALLYRDDLTMPIGRVPAFVATLQRLAAVASGVCKLTVTLPGVTKYGTAFRITDKWLLTNWHILHDTNTGQRATAVAAEFAYDDDGKGGLIAAVPVGCDPSKIVTSKADDWAVIPATDPLRPEWVTLPLAAAVAPVKGGAAYIIQHPAGERKRIGFVRNQISDFNDRVVHYLTDTQEGSSGAPVFDDQGRLIAIHHAGGTPQEVAGKQPVKKNEGILISCVSKGLTAAGWPG